MSSTYPPIETYNLNYSKSQFEKKLNEIKFKNDYELTFTDTTGIDKDTELNYYFNIIDKRTKDKFLMNFKTYKPFYKNGGIKLSLIGLTNEIENIKKGTRFY